MFANNNSAADAVAPTPDSLLGGGGKARVQSNFVMQWVADT